MIVREYYYEEARDRIWGNWTPQKEVALDWATRGCPPASAEQS